MNVMRMLYALMAFAMGSMIWKAVLNHGHLERWHAVGLSLLAALAVMALIGIRYPIQMLPILLFEFSWKIVFVFAFAFPLWRAGQLDLATRESAIECIIGLVICPIAIPWGYVWRNYMKKSGDPFRRASVTSNA